MFSFFFFVCKQNTAYEVRISYWSSDVCSSDLDLSPFRHRVEWHPSLERCEGAQISNGRVCDRAADTIERVDELEPLIDVLSVLLEAGHREHDRGRRRCREIVDLALELVGVRPATKRRCPGLRELEYRPRELIENVD